MLINTYHEVADAEPLDKVFNETLRVAQPPEGCGKDLVPLRLERDANDSAGKEEEDKTPGV